MSLKEKNIIREVHHYDKTEFPVTLYCFDEKTTDYIPIPIHFHEEIEIIYFQEGHATYKIDGLDYLINSESIIIINKNSPHSIKKLHTDRTKGYIFIFSPNILEGSIDDFCTSKYISPLIERKMDITCCIKKEENFELFKTLKNILLDIFEINKNQKLAYEMRIKAKFIEFFSFLFEYSYVQLKEISNKELCKRKKMEKIFSFIHENYKGDIPFERVAKIIDVSEVYFGRIFKEYTGLKFTDYLNIYRTNQAAKFLVNTDTSITDICYETGFSNFSYFIRTFKKNHKDTPGNYRKKFSKSFNSDIKIINK